MVKIEEVASVTQLGLKANSAMRGASPVEAGLMSPSQICKGSFGTLVRNAKRRPSAESEIVPERPPPASGLTSHLVSIIKSSRPLPSVLSSVNG